ncbi:TonB-dependent receptor [Chelatococcus reniformis]|uniref:TonB-dependent receptor n=1 Tax=Chelatococcus reniformis TaxID=1494448 RepID=UPI001AEED19C|nr:TonB-dependent receptor [Chelatococcus reniformis]
MLIGSTIVGRAQDNGSTVNLDEITVTANKREQPLDKVDGGVSVATGEELRERDVRTVTDLQKVFPGLVIDSRGNRAYANFTVRGMSSPDYYNPAVQVYVDGVPQAASAMVQELVDVERVEFLRGPQGTLYGRNAYAGVINIISRKPREQTAAVFGTAASGLFQVGATATAVLVPETWFLDLAVKESYTPGQIRDIDRGRDDINWWNAFNGRVGLRYAPAGGAFDANAWVSHEALRSREETSILDQDVRHRFYRSSVIGPYSFLDRNITTAGLTWNYRFNAFTLSSTTAYQDVDLKRKIFGSDFPETDRSITQELKLTYDDGGPLKGVAGLSYWADWFTRDAVGYPGFYAASRNKVDSQSAGIFGEVTYALTERLTLTGGVRGSYDWSSVDFVRPDVYGNGQGFDFDRSASFRSLQPKLSLGYQMTDSIRVYALVSEGYKPGGFNRAVSFPQDATPYKPETAWNFEVGARTSLWNGWLTLSTALYYIRSQDKQIYVGPIGLQVIRNAGEAESLGVEVEATLRATERLTLTATGSFGRSTFSDMVDPLSGAAYDNKRVPYAPDVTANLAARYVLPQSFFPGQVVATGAARMISRTYFNEANTLYQPAYATFDAGLEFVFDKGPTLKLFADNLTDKVYRTSSFEYGGAVLSTIGQGRIVGVQMRTQF